MIDNLIYPFYDDYIKQINNTINLDDEDALNREESKKAKNTLNAIKEKTVITSAISNYLFGNTKLNLKDKVENDFDFIIYFVVNNNKTEDIKCYKLTMHYTHETDVLVANKFNTIESISGTTKKYSPL
ncbi:MAG: hypothetical protein MSC51_04220 [Mollicutes bacterium]|nr:hypothetical protein [Mollicutes bacterium]